MKQLPVSLLSLLMVSASVLSHTQSVSAQKAPACVSPYGSQAVEPARSVALGGEGQGVEMAELAIAFLKVGRPQRTAQLNQRIQSRFKTPAEEMVLLSVIQKMAAGQSDTALARLSKLQLDPTTAEILLTQVLEMPESEQTQWTLKAIDRFPPYWQRDEAQVNWLVDLARHQQDRGRKADITLLEKARSIPLGVFGSVKLSEAYRRNGGLQTARSLLESVLQKIQSNLDSPTRSIFARIQVARQFARVGQPERALSELQSIDELIQQQSWQNDGNLIKDLSLAYAAAGKPDKALAWAALIKQDPDETRSDIAKHYAEQGELRLTQQVFDLIRDRDAKNSAVFGLTNHLIQRGQFEAAITFAQKLTLPYEQPRLFAQIAHKAYQANQKDIGDRAVKLMYPNYTVSELKRTAGELIQVGYLSRAKTVLLEAVALAIETRQQQEIPAIAAKFTAVGDPERANQLLDEQFVASERTPIPLSQDVFLIGPLPFLLTANFQGGTAVEKFFFYRRMFRSNPPPSLIAPPKLKQYKPNLLNLPVPPSKSPYDAKAINLEQFTHHYIEAHNFTKANALIQRIPDKYCNFKANAFLAVVPEAVKAGQSQVALNALSKVPQLQIYQDSVRQNLLAIANLYLDQKQSAKAIPLLEQALNLSRN